MFKNYFKTALKALKKNKGFTTINIVGLSVGIAACLLISGDFIKLVCISILIASPVGWFAMNKWLEDFAYRINISWLVFLVAGMIAVAIALIIISFQSIKAAIANPVKSLRTE